jgi:hypothetical protein
MQCMDSVTVESITSISLSEGLQETVRGHSQFSLCVVRMNLYNFKGSAKCDTDS